MSTIDTELATLHARIAQLEEAKKVPPPVKSLETIRDETANVLSNPKYVRDTRGAFYDRQRLEIVQAILESLNRIHARLDALERK